MQIHDELAVVGEKMGDAELVNMALNGFPTSWEPFVKGICSCENIPNFERPWDDCIQEDTLMESKAKKKGSDENLALFSQSKKGKLKDPTRVRKRVRSHPHNQERRTWVKSSGSFVISSDIMHHSVQKRRRAKCSSSRSRLQPLQELRWTSLLPSLRKIFQ